ncbi:NmrA family NAD(P)-binding protein [Streptomyces tsukubensis]|uniref:Ergot alkaloid biosynthesis protein n=1 Tax=Streptomyces tsukubensis TaxID=83656 RepID=A0A1V4A0A8_9ACTN|nr:NAD(P)H-binding protein [Streptomyces tsukubensis]OON72248.1 ergot alkaloid biosynthesis protein [Streptomyces tsukubensis]QFR94146.1 NAD(P)H-binding protein [Streptomyces tsukubensis]
MTASATTLVIGATGTTGSRVASRLAAGGHRLKAASRRATPVAGAEAVRFDWHDATTFDEALSGADRVYLVAPTDTSEPATVMLPFLERARKSGVRRTVLLSSSAIPSGGLAMGQVHQRLPGLFDEWAVLRPSWFMQNFAERHPHAQSIAADGTILTATGEGRVGFVDADDIAAVGVRALTDPQAPDTDLILTGPQALSYGDIAATLTDVLGRTVTHRRLTYEQMRDRLAADMPVAYASMLAGMDHSIAEGSEDRTTDTVQRLTGRPPGTFRAFAEREMT